MCGAPSAAEPVATSARSTETETLLNAADCFFSTTAVILFGCARTTDDKWTRDRPATHRVTGRVEIQGVPVDGAKVVFLTASPLKGKNYSAFGYTNARGAFTLQTFRDGDGAVAGEHQVTIEKITYTEPPSPKNEADNVPPPQETSHLPERYRSPKTSGLTADVEPDRHNTFSFSIDGN